MNNPPIRIDTIAEYHKLRGLPQPQHPLISVVDFSKVKFSSESFVNGFYNIAIKKGLNGKLYYGQQEYDFDGGAMSFIAPNQVLKMQANSDELQKRSGWMLLFHPDFLWNSSLAKKIKRYDFFRYSINEALFVSEREEMIINTIVNNISQECESNIDKFSQDIIISQIETLLNYSERFYQRQFITRKITNHKILDQFDILLDDYLCDNDVSCKGLPSVQSISEHLGISPSYLTSVVKILTGHSAQQYIHQMLIEKSKEKLSTTDLSVSEIAYELGFEHPQSFSRLFKAKTSLSPLEFRNSFKN
ncbi:AraC family transcriptional regulator [Chryseobacterium indologenes]|uniref:AraC family transcriptional regulator n=2 Tax=Chryseobacterium indologenes TaxID=253 RepID=A0A0N0ITZ5_CHRID|nr:AraC family transcriptional regulator [Chryseobacterium indologenes]